MKRTPPSAAASVPAAGPKPAAGRPRPGFPARLNTAPTAPAPRAGGSTEVARKPAAPLPSASGVGMDSSAVRQAMVRKLQAQGISHPAVLSAMLAVERHRFVDSALVPQAYEDTSLPIGLGQTISKPSVVARMLELLCQGRDLPLGRVLDIGTGCGYQAAVLSHLSREIYSMERLKALHEKARSNLRHFRLPNVHLLFGDGMPGYPQGAPYAGIVAAAGGNDVPPAWMDQLAVGGRLVAPAVTANGQQHLVMIERTAHGFTRSELEPVLFVPLKSGVS
ncbi:MAG: protein-L-isoaspartate(D-aspartate) O-methyltransferase [Hydrogenophaga sp.]|nr:protein-L-isoaspartate(D-aspartate) O-methyltransferase [Hydrogenophaga sp.]